MSDLQKKVEAAIIETLTNQYGAGSDLEFCRPDRKGEWVHLEGNLDVPHLASDMIYAVQKEQEYEYSMATRDEISGEWKVVGDFMDRYNKNPIWRDREVTQKMVDWYVNDFPNSEFKMVKRRKAGEVEDA